MLQNYTLFWQSVFSLTDCTWHDVTLNITFTRAPACWKSDFLATFCSDPSIFWLAINSLYCSLTWKHGRFSFAHQSLLARRLVSRPWFAQVNPTSGSELRLQLPVATSSSRVCVRSVVCLGFCRFHQCKKPGSHSIMILYTAPCLSSGLSLSLTLVSSCCKVVISLCATRIL